MLNQILKILTFGAILQSLIILIILMIKNGNNYERLILMLLFITFGIFLTGNVIFIYYRQIDHYDLFHVLNLVIFLSAPLLYFYFQGKLNNKSTIKPPDLLHALPFILIFGFIFQVMFFRTGKPLRFNNYGPFITAALFLQNLFYFILVLKKIKEKKNNINLISRKLYDREATVNSVNFEITWLHRLFLLFFIIICFQTSVFLSCRLFSLFRFCVIFTGIFFILSFILINSFILLGLSKSTLFEEKGKYLSKGLKEEIKSEYLKKLEKALLIDKIYLHPLITLERLSKELKIPRNDLSRIINENFALNFNEMINQFRINDAKSLIRKSEGNIPIIDIAYSVGYNSKSTFNTAFKRYTGKTPSSYQLN